MSIARKKIVVDGGIGVTDTKYTSLPSINVHKEANDIRNNTNGSLQIDNSSTISNVYGNPPNSCHVINIGGIVIETGSCSNYVRPNYVNQIISFKYNYQFSEIFLIIPKLWHPNQADLLGKANYLTSVGLERSLNVTNYNLTQKQVFIYVDGHQSVQGDQAVYKLQYFIIGK